MAQLPYRYQEILTALRDHPEGLTTKQIFDECQKHGGSELPNTAITGQCVFALRNAGIPSVSTHDGGVHKITQHGLDRLAEALELEKPVNLGAAIALRKSQAAGVKQKLTPDPDILTQLDSAFATIRSAIVDTLNHGDGIKIKDKQRKIATLEQLENLPVFTQDIADMLAAIRGDLEQLEGE
ncbi:MAG: hypothetical protein WAW41_05345 [Methylobacter sp.]